MGFQKTIFQEEDDKTENKKDKACELMEKPMGNFRTEN
jgi:hypothetical protein